MHHYICTVGTSLLTNTGWRPGVALPAEETLQTTIREKSPQVASAELNTLLTHGLTADDSVALLHSDSDDGRLASRGLRTWLVQEHKMRASHVTETQLGTLNLGAVRLRDGLRALVVSALDEIKRAQQGHRTPILVATGGFKVESAYLALVGQLSHVGVIYIYERDRELLTLPPLPVTWDVEGMRPHEECFRKLRSGKDKGYWKRKELNSFLSKEPRLAYLVSEVELDGEMYLDLNAAGVLVAEALLGAALPAVLLPPSSRAPQDKNLLSTTEHHRPKGWERVVNVLCAQDWIDQVRYDERIEKGEAIRVLDAAGGHLGYRYKHGELQLALRLETTGRGDAACQEALERLAALQL